MGDPSLRDRIRGGQSLLGCFLTWPTAGVGDLLAIAGFDFAVLDMEHGFFGIEAVESLVRAADAQRLPAIVRVPSCSAPETGRSLDAGAAGILFPRANEAEEVRRAAATAKYPPRGVRGLGGVRANRYATVPLDAFVSRANEETLVAVQIETAGALADLDRIAGQEDVDILYVGPNDLTQALGIPGRTEDARYREALRRVAETARQNGKTAGIMLGGIDQLRSLAEIGFRLFTTSDRTLILESARAWRQALPRPI